MSVKGRSPFYPGQPVPIELFVGRQEQIDKIVSRGVKQVAEGKSMAMFVQGDYGIGKSSIARYTQFLAEQKYGLLGIYASLGGTTSLDEMGSAILEATVRSGALNPKNSEQIRNLLAKYIGEQSIFGFTIHAEALKKDAPRLASPNGLLPFFAETLNRVKVNGIKGIFLILDEVNGITANPKFAHFIKGLVESNAMSSDQTPLLLMLCGVEERRREMIKNHQPIDRIFEIIDIKTLDKAEMEKFFMRAFASVQTAVDPSALETMTKYSAGFPKIMHLVGDAAYWIDRDDKIDHEDALRAVIAAADDVGKKFVDQQVYAALRSKDYHSILAKIAKMGPDAMSFMKQDLEKGLTANEKKKLNNFLQKMKKLRVLKMGETRGEWLFTMRMVRFYIWLDSLKSPE
ncbi:MAG: BREX system ATP-binding domain-containing protein [Elusimicrobiota bacterium]